jgi:hypothetical protein
MESKAENLLREMCIPESIITQVLKITKKEEEAVNLALEFMENPQPSPSIQTSVKPYQNPPKLPEPKPAPVYLVQSFMYHF